MPYIGAHVSAAGGLWKAVENAQKIGAEAIQIFGSSPRQWRVRPLGEEERDRFQKAVSHAKLGPTFFHAPYLINLGSPNASLRKKSAELLQKNLENASFLGIAGVIFHIGSRRELPWEKAKKYVVSSLRAILYSVPGETPLVIENSAGGGNTIGSSLKEIQEIMDEVGNPLRLRFCFDTAHALESGMVERYTHETVEKLAQDIVSTLGKEALVAVHLNDSKTPYNSHADRHENIGDGYIGKEGLRTFVCSSFFQSVPWYLEVPGRDGQGPDKENVQRVRSLLRRCPKK